MRVTSVTAHYERKINLGDYNSMTLSAWATVEIGDGADPRDEPDEALRYGMELCRAEVKATATEILAGRRVPGVTTQEEFAGLKVDGGE